MFSRGDWSLHISAEPSWKGFRQTTVKFYAAQTSSFVNLAQDTAAAVVKSQGPQQPLDVLQNSANEDYHTTITTKNEPPKQAFQDALEEEIRKGWKPTFSLPEKQPSSRYFIWLTKGQRYSALSVQLTQQGDSSVTLVEVTPH
jgi:CHAD domain-containing protein